MKKEAHYGIYGGQYVAETLMTPLLPRAIIGTTISSLPLYMTKSSLRQCAMEAA